MSSFFSFSLKIYIKINNCNFFPFYSKGLWLEPSSVQLRLKGFPPLYFPVTCVSALERLSLRCASLCPRRSASEGTYFLHSSILLRAALLVHVDAQKSSQLFCFSLRHDSSSDQRNLSRSFWVPTSTRNGSVSVLSLMVLIQPSIFSKDLRLKIISSYLFRL